MPVQVRKYYLYKCLMSLHIRSIQAIHDVDDDDAMPNVRLSQEPTIMEVHILFNFSHSSKMEYLGRDNPHSIHHYENSTNFFSKTSNSHQRKVHSLGG